MIKKLNLAIFFWVLLLLNHPALAAQNPLPARHFYVMPLGTSGGELEDNLSAYLVAAWGTHQFIALDAGTLCASIKKIPSSEYQKLGITAAAGKSLAETLLTRDVQAYFISHAHLDHINGLIICSTIDSHKEILGVNTTIDYLRDNIFNWKIWPNFADEGVQPQLKQYHYHRLNFANPYSAPGTAMTVQAFPLSHGNGYPSTGFLLESKGYYLLYLGDTGADPLEHSQDMHQIWQRIAPLVRSHKLSAIFIEASYPNNRPDSLLFGHLTPHWLLFELNDLARLVDPKQPASALQGLNIVVTHIKQGLEQQSQAKLITEQLNAENHLGVKFIIPQPIQSLGF